MKRTRITLNTCGAVAWFTFGLSVCYGASRLGLGNITDPGPGFIFFWSGSILTLLSLMLLFNSLQETAPEDRETGRTNWTKVACVLAALLFFAFFLEKLGFVFTTFLLLCFLLGVSGGKSWLPVLGVASAAAVGSFALFELWLKIRLPKGIFGF
ncbi:MAG TPA: tripartite tricarboxylate transporter TctB family protein [Candidatus Binatia bacterium]|nr:tripartite tricarboxylate transporter TctB family protein [Candidatus Binatia bacterium]